MIKEIPRKQDGILSLHVMLMQAKNVDNILLYTNFEELFEFLKYSLTTPQFIKFKSI